MATDDVTHKTIACACKEGTVMVTMTSPDHPWVRASQTTYEATINCPKCAKVYVVDPDETGRIPDLLPKEQYRAWKVARDAFFSYLHEVGKSAEAERLKPRIRAALDRLPSMAAKHRALVEMRLASQSLPTFRKSPDNSVRTAVEFANGEALAHIGSGPLGGSDQPFFANAAKKLGQLEAAYHKLEPQHVRLA